MDVAVRPEANGHRRQREVVRVAGWHFVPVERRRDARVGRRANGVGAGNRAVFRVLVVIEKDALPLLLPPFAGRHVRHAPFDFAREGQRRTTHIGEGPLRLDPHVDVQAARA
jgi:hypothetical protein